MSRRDEVLQAAVELLDEVGLDDLTTRRLADRLGIQAGALYRHFASKRALLDAVVESIAASALDQPVPAGDWADQLRAMAGAAREAMLAHRDGARLIATFQVPGPAVRSGFERFAGVLRTAGASSEVALVGADTIFAYINGFTIEEQARKVDPPTEFTRAERDRHFAAGLELIIAGLRAAR